ncbi:PTR2-domain-containing protein [Nadsonia fulvescens var. elongata DSM 6958]|uniref:PTR2-domain-containing protein n=1 Tax=Nadsonia fulvescens var. elongata DSM 6958 TaxID=857566 RepID=A0A1E3PDD3_9ASCO|nr:PTR2-domain-containing protein [Nadsonia fulvescens var. elongata DSM 6958]
MSEKVENVVEASVNMAEKKLKIKNQHRYDQKDLVEQEDGTETISLVKVNTNDNCLGPLPTFEEEQTLRHISDKLPSAAWLVAVVELCERFTYYGVSGPFQNYMQYDYSASGQRGGVGLGQQGATALSYFFQFWCYVTPILGAIMADTWWGKYKTICVFSGIYVVGIFILFMTSLPFAIENGAALGGLVTAMIVIGLGTGGIKSNVSPLIADQYTNTKKYIKTLKSGERVIVDPTATIQTLFMVFYFCINVGSLSSIATTELEKNVDFWASFLLPFCFFFVGIISLILGSKFYVKKPAMGSVIPQSIKVLVIAAKNGFSLESAKPSVRAENGSSPVIWSDLFVDEVKRALYACSVFAFFPIYWVVYGQMLNNFVSQAGQMATHGIPNDLMQNIDPIAIIIFIPICEKILYPALRRFGIKFKPVTRIFWGFIFAALAMAYAAIVQHLIYSAGPCFDAPNACPASMGGKISNQVHVAVQTPAYFFIAMSEIFASITGLEYAYTKAPSSMKSFIMSLFLLTSAFGSAIGIALSPASVDPKLVWMYTGLAVATLIAGILFWFIFRGYNAMEEELNIIDADYNAELYANIAHREKEMKADTDSNHYV